MRFIKTYRSGLEVAVDVYSPEYLTSGQLWPDGNARLKELFKSHEIIYLNGLASEENLRLMEQAESYPARTYQIFFLDASWAYGAAINRIFQAKRDGDTDGRQLADVLCNTEPGRDGGVDLLGGLYRNLIRGASELASGRSPQARSWNNLVRYMNYQAASMSIAGQPAPALYGLSGVLNNRFAPLDSITGETLQEQGKVRFENNDGTYIPDGFEEGITRNIEVSESLPIGSLQVTVNIQHTYIGELTVELERGGQTLVLWENQGVDQDNLERTFMVNEFNGQDARGTWTLRVRDLAAEDQGTLLGWTLVITRP